MPQGIDMQGGRGGLWEEKEEKLLKKIEQCVF